MNDLVRASREASSLIDLAGTPGIYLICDESAQALYVGESTNIAERIPRHADKFSGMKTRVFFIKVVEPDVRCAIEAAIIRYLKPKYNKKTIFNRSQQGLRRIEIYEKGEQ
ncbi:MAG: GIY-YIG nuclease family protein [Candidatus Paceibacterota bacterium]